MTEIRVTNQDSDQNDLESQIAHGHGYPPVTSQDRNRNELETNVYDQT